MAASSAIRAVARQVYLPGTYLVRVKRPLQPGAFRQLMTDDLALWMLIAAPGPGLRFLAGIAALFLSLWSVYEIGYCENDVCATRLEADPVVSAEFACFDTARFTLKACMSAVLLALGGALMIRPAAFPATAAAWLAVLAALRAVFWLYNRIDKTTRVWLYLVLHMFRTLALAAVLPIGAPGMIAGVTQIVARWQDYLCYRMARTAEGFRWRNSPLRLIQLLLFLLCLGTLARAGEDVWCWRSAALLGWSFFLARKDIRVALQSAHRLHRAAKELPAHEDLYDQGLAGRPAPERRSL
jgi:hypothetical protein